MIPTRPGKEAKNPGSLLRSRWQERSTRDRATAQQYWCGEGRTDRGIALHAGKSGAVIFDVDKPDALPGWMRKAFAQAPYFTTSESGRRRHYVFRQPVGRIIGNSLGSLPKGWGQVRGLNGVVAVFPTVHPEQADRSSAKDPSDLGMYRIGRPGVVRALPTELAKHLVDATPETVECVTDAAVAQFLDAHKGATHPRMINGPLRAFADRDGGRYDAARDSLCWAMREAYAGAYSAREAHDALADLYRDAFIDVPGRRPEHDEWSRLCRFAVSAAVGSDPKKTLAKLDRDHAKSSRAIFTRVSARELAAPVKPMEWLVRDVWALNSFGPLGGEKKTLKTYNLLAMAIAVASGEPMFGEFPVERPGPVVLYIAEGGQVPFQRRAQRVADAYKVKLEDLPLTVVFGMAPLNGSAFLDHARDLIDDVQPVLFGLDPLYAFHPGGVDAGNVYERGPMLQQLRADLGEDLSLIVPDHFNKTATKGTLDLDMIAQAGWGPAADSWILQAHREPPDLTAGLFHLKMHVGSRQWGGRNLSVDWSVPTPDEDGTTPDARTDRITWNVDKLRDEDAGAGVRPSKSYAVEKAERRVLEVLDDHPFELTKTQVADKVGGNAGTARDAIENLLTDRLIEVQKVAFPNANGRPITRDRLGRRDANALKLQPGRKGVPPKGRGRDGVSP